MRVCLFNIAFRLPGHSRRENGDATICRVLEDARLKQMCRCSKRALSFENIHVFKSSTLTPKSLIKNLCILLVPANRCRLKFGPRIY